MFRLPNHLHTPSLSVQPRNPQLAEVEARLESFLLRHEGDVFFVEELNGCFAITAACQVWPEDV